MSKRLSPLSVMDVFMSVVALGFAVVIFSLVTLSFATKVTFQFTEFPYKETTKNEMAFHEYESACEQSPSCTQLRSVARTRCVRECISPSCYSEIYQADPLEEGEIDVRLNSFKGCFVQRVHRHRP